MKTYIVYAGHEEVGEIKAGSHNAAEKKAQAKYGDKYPGLPITVVYTEV